MVTTEGGSSSTATALREQQAHLKALGLTVEEVQVIAQHATHTKPQF